MPFDPEELLEDSLEFKRWKHEEPYKMDWERYLKQRGNKERTQRDE